jgi:DNA-binding NarL/FixJ family response regulator
MDASGVTPELPPPPAELAWLSQHLAPPALLALIEAFGGTRIYVPKSPNQASPLVQAIGREAAAVLAAAHGGDELSIPIARHWQVRCLKGQGLSYREIALRLRISENSVWNHLRAASLTHAQPDLFG